MYKFLCEINLRKNYEMKTLVFELHNGCKK